MSGLIAGSTPASSSVLTVSGASQLASRRRTHLMKCSGVLPVGSEITPPGWPWTHSINRMAASLPSAGKLPTTIVAIFSVGS